MGLDRLAVLDRYVREYIEPWLRKARAGDFSWAEELETLRQRCLHEFPDLIDSVNEQILYVARRHFEFAIESGEQHARCRSRELYCQALTIFHNEHEFGSFLGSWQEMRNAREAYVALRQLYRDGKAQKNREQNKTAKVDAIAAKRKWQVAREKFNYHAKEFLQSALEEIDSGDFAKFYIYEDTWQLDRAARRQPVRPPAGHTHRP